MKRMSICVFLLALALVSCHSQIPPLVETETVNRQDAVETIELPLVTGLQSELADPDWDGKQIPKNQKCQKFGGENPSTPRILVGNIPEGSDAIILEFSDRDYSPMDNGGHGKIGFVIPEGESEVEVPLFLGIHSTYQRIFSLSKSIRPLYLTQPVHICPHAREDRATLTT